MKKYMIHPMRKYISVINDAVGVEMEVSHASAVFAEEEVLTSKLSLKQQSYHQPQQNTYNPM